MKKVFIVIATLCLFSIPSTVFACSCAPGDPPVEFNRAKAVFIGRMLGGTEKLSIKDQGAKPRFIEAGDVRFAVEEVFKGRVEDEATIKIASNEGTSCGPYGLQRGERYVVYAYADEKDEKILHTGVCTRTMTTGSKYAKDDLDFLRNLPPPGVGGNIRGRIWADLRAEGDTPLPDVRVNIRTGDEQPITVFTDKEGQFEVKQLKAGKYKVEPEFPANYTSERKHVEVKVDDRGTAGVWFEAYIDGRVSGRVVDKEGNTYSSISLKMVGGGKTVYGHSKGEDGRFEVEGAPPGEYVLYFEMQNADYKKNKHYYYPGTFEREKAAVIRVGMEEKVDGLEFLLPDGFKVRTVEGEVVWEDGKPAPNVEVMLLLCPHSARPDGFTVEFGPTRTRTNEQGQFRLEGFTGETYWIEARGRRQAEKQGEFVEAHSPSRKLSLLENLKSLKVVLSESGFFGGCPR